MRRSLSIDLDFAGIPDLLAVSSNVIKRANIAFDSHRRLKSIVSPCLSRPSTLKLRKITLDGLVVCESDISQPEQQCDRKKWEAFHEYYSRSVFKGE
jgi:hypothetical protein